jgi:CRISPR-associated protein Csb2
MTDRVAELERHFIGRKADGSNSAPIEARVRIIAIPSIGTRFADRGIRRLLVEVPSACTMQASDVRWAFSGAEIVDARTGEVAILAPCEDASMLRHYAVGEAARVFRTVTPIVLSDRIIQRRPGEDGAESAERRRFHKAALGSAKQEELSVAAGAIAEAMRHAGLRTRIEAVRLQREPFDAAGERAESFAKNTRFAPTRLWHVELVLEQAVKGPLLLGDGRFLGLGIMAPVQHYVQGLHEFEIVEGLNEWSAAADVTRALRRAVMARVQAEIGTGRELGTFFTGHAQGGAIARGDRDAHLAFAFDPTSGRLFIISPHLLERRTESRTDVENLRILAQALEGFDELVAGRAGRLTLRRLHSDPNQHALLSQGCSWVSVTPYVVTRHARGHSAAEAAAADVRSECHRVGLPTPDVEVQNTWGEPGRGLTSYVQLTFPVGISGPLILGRDRYFGGGLFRRPLDRKQSGLDCA